MSERLNRLDEAVRMLEQKYAEIVARLDQAGVFSRPVDGEAKIKEPIGQLKAKLGRRAQPMLATQANTTKMEDRLATNPPPPAPLPAGKQPGAWSAAGWPLDDAQLAEAAERLVARIRTPAGPHRSGSAPSGSVADMSSGAWESKSDPLELAGKEPPTRTEPPATSPPPKKEKDSDVTNISSTEWQR